MAGIDQVVAASQQLVTLCEQALAGPHTDILGEYLEEYRGVLTQWIIKFRDTIDPFVDAKREQSDVPDNLLT